MDKFLMKKLEEISKSRNDEDITFVETEIGKIRLKAEKSTGIKRFLLHKKANLLEEELQLALQIGDGVL